MFSSRKKANEEDLTCPYCNEIFQRKNDVTRHIQTILKCDGCDEQFPVCLFKDH